MERAGALVVVLLAAGSAHAEGVGTPTRASTADRLYGAQTLSAVPGGVISVGGPALRRLADGAKRWETLHTVEGDNLYRVAHDDQGRLLAAWEKEPLIHYFAPAQNVHVTFAKPVGPADLEHGHELDSLELLPNGRDALVYMTGTVKITTGRFRGPAACTFAYRVPLDGKSPAQLLFRQNHGYRLHTSRFGALFAMPLEPGNQCDHRGCNVASIIAYEISDAGASPRTLYSGEQAMLSRARLMRGSEARRVVLILDAFKPTKHLELLRFRYGDAQADVRTMPFPARDDQTSWLVMTNDDVVELRGMEGGLEVWRHGQDADERIASLKALRNIDISLHGFGERANGDLWLHYGDHLGFVARGKPPLAYDMGSMLSSRTEWAGTMYVKSPEQAWVGIDSRGRDFARVFFADAEKRSRPWPAGVDPTVVPFGESVGYQKKDPSTAQKLYGATTLRPMTGGLFSIGGPALRRLPAGASKWEALLVLEGDSLYRAAADPAGRLLATWEKDPLIHLFSQGQHVTFPKPLKPPSVRFDFYVDDIFFSPDGRDALVYMRGRLDMGARDKTVLYRIALDGKSAPRMVFEVDDAYLALMSAAGAVFVLPETPGKECSHRTCFPISAVVAYEVTAAGFTPRTLLTAAQADVAGTWTVNGSGDTRVALVFELIKRDGPRRLNGGRSLLRWRWGDSKVDYRMLPGHTDLQPVWTVTESMDFVELRRQYDDTGQLEIRRYKPGMAEEVVTLRPRDRGLPPYGVGERGSGGLWVHWADDLVLISPGKPPRGFNVGSVLGRGLEWAGAATYVRSPEALWIGLDGRGRHYARIDLTEAEKRSRPWP